VAQWLRAALETVKLVATLQLVGRLKGVGSSCNDQTRKTNLALSCSIILTLLNHSDIAQSF